MEISEVHKKVQLELEESVSMQGSSSWNISFFSYSSPTAEEAEEQIFCMFHKL